jgi:phosphonopyruvate decarboxylase
MISSKEFVDALRRWGFTSATGVPCSYLSGPVARLQEEGSYLPAANEGSALAIAAGAATRGRRMVLLAQNSGFGNLLNPLTSLVQPYEIPVLIVMSMRGWPDPECDEPQHRVMGSTVHRFLDVLRIHHTTLDGTAADLDEALAGADKEIACGRPSFLLIPKTAIAKQRSPQTVQDPARPARMEAIESVVERFPDSLVVSTTGYTSRELFALGHSDRYFYMQGSMGHADAFGLGVALAEPRRQVVVLDGDGAVLMHMGAMSTVGAVLPENYLHIVFDNGRYESTGGQETSASTTSFSGVALAAGYRAAHECRGLVEFRHRLDEAERCEGPRLLALTVAAGQAAATPRASSEISMKEIHSCFANIYSSCG